MIKVIHTADWHIGQDFYHYDRSGEHRHFFSQLADLVRTEQPDVLLVCGDVFHTATPSNSSMKLYTDSMMQLHMACSGMQIVVTAGNHDSCSRLAATAEVWKLANVHVVGGMEWDAESGMPFLERHILEIPHKAFIIAVPYIHERYHSVFMDLQQMVGERNSEGLPVLMTGHLALRGSDITGHDPSIIGGMETVSLSDYGSLYDYWALGHIHRPQTLPASGGRVRYSGSPLHVSFDENYPHSVTLVLLQKHGDLPVIKEVPVCQLVHTLTIPSRALPLDEVLRILRREEPHEPSYVRVRVLVKDYLNRQAVEQIQELLSLHPEFHFCLIQNEQEQFSDTSAPILYDTRRIQDSNPVDVAKACYRSKFGLDLDDMKVKMLEEIVASMNPDK